MKKRFIGLTLALAIVFSFVLTSCTSNTTPNSGSDTTPQNSSTNDKTNPNDGEKLSIEVKSSTMGGEQSGQYAYMVPYLGEELNKISMDILGYEAFNSTGSYGGTLASTETEHVEMVMNGEIPDGKSQTAILKAKKHISGQL